MTSGYAVATLAAFIISIFFVIHPVSIPTPRPLPSIQINLVTAPILAVVLLWTTQCLDSVAVHNGIMGTDDVKPYNILVLFFSLAYMAITLDLTGILKATMLWVSNKGGSNGWKLYLYFYVMLTLLSILLGIDPIVLSGTAFLVYYTESTQLLPTPWIMAGFAAANIASMILHAGNLTNVIICEGFGVKNAAFTMYTILPFVTCSIFCIAALAFQFRMQVQRQLIHAEHQVPWSALLDPVGALVGSCVLVTTSILLVVLPFSTIDAWMVTLPLAVGKLLFDLVWDYYRYSHPEIFPRIGDSPLRRALFIDLEQLPSSLPGEPTRAVLRPSPPIARSQFTSTLSKIFWSCWLYTVKLRNQFSKRFPTVVAAFLRLPLPLIPFTFSQFILIEALDHQGWVDVFANWLVRASHNRMHPTIWLIGILGLILCNISGTNIGATILLTKVVRAAALPHEVNRAAAIALAIASNIAAIGFTPSASLPGLAFRTVLGRNGVQLRQREFAFWNLLPLLTMATVGLGIVSAEMAALYRS